MTTLPSKMQHLARRYALEASLLQRAKWASLGLQYDAHKHDLKADLHWGSLTRLFGGVYDLSDFDEKLLQARKCNIEKQVKEKVDRVNLDEIPSGPVGIDADFEEIYKNKEARYEGKLSGDDPYFDSLDSDSAIRKEEGDFVDDDEVVDPPPKTSSTKIYFDKIAK
ncbi:hypothetical protein CQW23_01337 [Capsicum baccatum]|uniref:Uncharacterized protein n=1 Tax=Capsicum baccatum TaxID=33114 RepID=A0A2G2XNA4_CAPBA|nr:hypothetical protein CQW23_01337 [Capsicum baccatum]